MSGDTKILDDLWGVIEERSSSLDKESIQALCLRKTQILWLERWAKNL